MKLVILSLFILLVGCSSYRYVLTDKDQMWFVPANTEVTVNDGSQRKQIVTNDTLLLMHRGYYLSLQKELDSYALRLSRIEQDLTFYQATLRLFILLVLVVSLLLFKRR